MLAFPTPTPNTYKNSSVYLVWQVTIRGRGWDIKEQERTLAEKLTDQREDKMAYTIIKSSQRKCQEILKITSNYETQEGRLGGGLKGELDHWDEGREENCSQTSTKGENN